MGKIMKFEHASNNFIIFQKIYDTEDKYMPMATHKKEKTNQRKRFKLVVLSLLLLFGTLMLPACSDDSNYVVDWTRIEFEDRIFGLRALSVYEDMVFVTYIVIDEPILQGDGEEDLLYAANNRQYIGWMSTDGTGLEPLFTLIHDQWENQDGYHFTHFNTLTRAAARPGGGLAALIAERRVLRNDIVGINEEREHTHLMLFAQNGIIEHKINLNHLLSRFVDTAVIGNSMQVLDDGRIVIAASNHVFVLTPNGDLLKAFEAEIESLIILDDGRAIATIFDAENVAWYTRYFDLETGEIIESDTDAIPSAYRSAQMLPGVHHHIYSLVGDNVYGINVDTRRAERLFRSQEFDARISQLVVSETGAFYFLDTQIEDPTGEADVSTVGNVIRVADASAAAARPPAPPTDVDPGDVDVEPGDIDVDPGDVDVEPGDIDVDPGDVDVEPGDVEPGEEPGEIAVAPGDADEDDGFFGILLTFLGIILAIVLLLLLLLYLRRKRNAEEEQVAEVLMPVSDDEVFDSEPVVEPTPEPVIEPVPVVEPTPEPVIEPEPVVEATPEPVIEPEPTPEPVAAVTPGPVVTPIPVPVAEPTPEPVVEPEPVAAVAPEPVVEPVAEPTQVATATFTTIPVTEPKPEPVVEPVVVEPIIIEPTVIEPIAIEPIVVTPEPVVTPIPVPAVEQTPEPVIEPEPVVEPVAEPTPVATATFTTIPVTEPKPEPVVEPIVVEPIVIEPTVIEPIAIEPIVVTPEPVAEPTPVATATFATIPVVESAPTPESVIEPEPVVESVPVVEQTPEPVIEPVPVVEATPEPAIEPEPVVTPTPIPVPVPTPVVAPAMSTQGMSGSFEFSGKLDVYVVKTPGETPRPQLFKLGAKRENMSLQKMMKKCGISSTVSNAENCFFIVEQGMIQFVNGTMNEVVIGDVALPVYESRVLQYGETVTIRDDAGNSIVFNPKFLYQARR